MKRKHWIALLSIALAVLVAGGSVTAWHLMTRTPPDTDSNAPFEDLSQWEKRRVLKAVAKYWTWRFDMDTEMPVWWYGELMPGQEGEMQSENYKHGVQYYGTFNGYHIILYSYERITQDVWLITKKIGEYQFLYLDPFQLFAYKDGTVIPLSEAYEKGYVSESQMGEIYQCYERYRQEIYFPNWPKVEN